MALIYANFLSLQIMTYITIKNHTNGNSDQNFKFLLYADTCFSVRKHKNLALVARKKLKSIKIYYLENHKSENLDRLHARM